jgi:chemotaxis protein MotB
MQTGTKGITIPKDATGGAKEGAAAVRSRDRARFQQIKQALEARIKSEPGLRHLQKSVRFTETREGLRIDLVDQADFAMFSLATARLLPDARRLMAEVANVIGAVPNPVIVRGHTDALPYASGQTTNNWTLSTARAEATRQALADSGVTGSRFARIEGVADREPYIPADAYDPRNRRMSITLGWSAGAEAVATAEDEAAVAG